MALRIIRKITRIRPVIKVERSRRPYHEEQGWQHTNGLFSSKLTGYYRTRYGSFKGKIELGFNPSFYIHNPPAELRDHSHWICFSARSGGWYSIHFSTRPRDVDSGIMTVERLITEAFED
jgi:hypothetical protein